MQGRESVSLAHPVVAAPHVAGGGEGVSVTQPGTGALGEWRRSPTWVPWSGPVWLGAVPGSPSADGRAARVPVGLLLRGPGSDQAMLSLSLLNVQPGRAQPSGTRLKQHEC